MNAAFNRQTRVYGGVTLAIGLVAVWSATATVASAQVTAPPILVRPPSNTGAVRGLVTDQATHRPLPAVQVTLRRDGTRPEVTLTNAEGRFQFRDLGPGRYTLSFLKAGFVALSLGQRTAFDDTMSIDLRDRQVVDNIAVALPPGSAIEGHVLDDTGFPVVEAKVGAMRYQWVDGGRRLLPAGRGATTDDRGHYRIWGLSSGEYVVGAAIGNNPMTTTDSNLGETTGFAPTYYPDSEDVSAAARVAVGSGGDATGVDITFHAVRLARVSGRVSTSSGRTGSITIILSLARSITGAAWLQGGSVAAAQVLQDGVFIISGVAPGQYVLRASEFPLKAIEAAVATEREDSIRLAASSGEFAAMPVTVTGQDLGGLSVTTAPTGRLQGRVTLDGVPHTENSAATAVVIASPAVPDISAAGPSRFVRNGSAFAIGGLMGRYLLRVTDLPTGVALESVTQAGQDVTDAGVDVGPGQAVSDVAVQLTSKPTRITGRIVAEGDAEVDGSTVVVFSTEKDRWTLPSTRYVAAARAGRDGRFQIEGLPAGPYLAIALGYVEREQWRDPDFLDAASKLATRVTLSAGTETTIDLRRQ